MVHLIAPFPEIFPRRVYHPQMESRIVRNKAELLSLGSGWQNAPYPAPEPEIPTPAPVAAPPAAQVQQLAPVAPKADPRTPPARRAVGRKAELS